MDRLTKAIETLGARVSQLRDWDLRSERTVSLLDSLSVFLSSGSETDPTRLQSALPETGQDELLFGDLSLRGIEFLAETWAKKLDPYWIQAKQEVRESFTNGGAPESYIATDQIVRHLNNDLLKISRIREIMFEALEAARRMDAIRTSSVADRISVAFVSS